MLIDAVSATKTSGTDIRGRAIASFLSFLERKLDVAVVRNARGLPDDSLSDPYRLAQLLKENGILTSFYRNSEMPDLPHMHSWSAHCNDKTNHQTGGASWVSDADALYAALAETLERYIWFMKNDYYVDPTWATVADIGKKGEFLAPDRFSGYTEAQRAKHPRRRIDADAEFTWIQGLSLVRNVPVYVPAQVVTGMRANRSMREAKEPAIRPSITIGLATWPTLEGARCAGVNETLEREAYMVMWLNQLTLPRYSLASLRKHDPALAKLIDDCERYRLKMHVIKMPTDAPTHAIAVVFEDMSGSAPRFTIGIKAHRSLSQSVQKAATEAIRAIRGHLHWARQGNVWDPATPASTVGHRDRLYYWGSPENAPRLEFLVAGEEIDVQPSPWDHDDAEAHLARLLKWCTDTGLECISVSLGRSPTNPTTMHIEMVVMPDLQWTYLSETTQTFGGTRWRDIPLKLGLTPRDEPFAAEPHPFS